MIYQVFSLSCEAHGAYRNPKYIKFIFKVLKLDMKLFADPFGFRKTNTDPHILTHVNIECTDDRYPKLKIYIQEPILERKQ